mgnify:CR=1 FL=1
MMKKSEQSHREVLPTGSLKLDIASGIGGYPKGSLVELFGGSPSGKTTLGLHAVAEAQRQGVNCLFIDLEKTLSPSYAAALGACPRRTWIAQPDSGEEALETAYRALRDGDFGLVVLDTLAALVPRRELAAGKSRPAGGEIKSLLTPALPRLRTALRNHRGLLLCINQTRTRLKVRYGTPQTTPGGMGVKLQAALRIKLERRGLILRAGSIQGDRIRATIIKNRMNSTSCSVNFNIVYNSGIEKEQEICSLAIKKQIIGREQSQYTFIDQKLGKNPQEIINYLRKNPDLSDRLENELRRVFLT